MTNQDNKPKNELGLFQGTKTQSKRDGDNPKFDNTGKKSFKESPKQTDRNNNQSNNKPYYSPANIGWLYYKDYYYGIDFKPDQKKDVFKNVFQNKNEVIMAQSLTQYSEEVKALEMDFDGLQSFELETQYPGLVTGLGTMHETGYDGEYKLGFQFDYTTGLPIIPGSSVKGVLRSAFKKSPEYIKYLIENLPNLESLVPDISALEKEIFDGEGLKPYQRDVFLDAVIISSKNKEGKFIADDFITPHGNKEKIFRDPIPLQFLKILPQVVFRFQFRLSDGLLTAVEKRNLFQQILKDLGIGAKTNVGYGKFKN